MSCCNSFRTGILFVASSGLLVIVAQTLTAAEPRRLTRDGVLKLAPVFVAQDTTAGKQLPVND